MSPRLRACLVGVLGLALLGLAACQDDDASGTPTTPSSSTTASGPTTAQTSSSGGASSPAPSSDVVPADGPELHLRVMSVHAPAGWKADKGQVTHQEISASSVDGLLQLIELEGATYASTDDTAADFMKSVPYADKIKRLPDVLLGQDQTPAARVAWTEKGNPNHYQAIIAYKDGVAASLNITVRPSLQKDESAFLDSVLASVQWLV